MESGPVPPRPEASLRSRASPRRYAAEARSRSMSPGSSSAHLFPPHELLLGCARAGHGCISVPTASRPDNYTRGNDSPSCCSTNAWSDGTSCPDRGHRFRCPQMLAQPPSPPWTGLALSDAQLDPAWFSPRKISLHRDDLSSSASTKVTWSAKFASCGSRCAPSAEFGTGGAGRVAATARCRRRAGVRSA